MQVRVLWLLEILLLALVPLCLVVCALFKLQHAALWSLAVVIAVVVLFFVSYEFSHPRLRGIMPTVVLIALAVAGRILFAAVPSFKPLSALCIIAGVMFGRQSGFMVGALSALISNFFFGQGPWTPWQMYSWGLIGYLAGVMGALGCFDRKGEKRDLLTRGRLFRFRNAFRQTSPLLYIYGFCSAFLYGLLVNTWHVIGFVQPFSPFALLVAYGAALPFDITHGVATVTFLALLYLPWKRKLERIKQKFGV